MASDLDELIERHMPERDCDGWVHVHGSDVWNAIVGAVEEVEAEAADALEAQAAEIERLCTNEATYETNDRLCREHIAGQAAEIERLRREKKLAHDNLDALGAHGNAAARSYRKENHALREKLAEKEKRDGEG